MWVMIVQYAIEHLKQKKFKWFYMFLKWFLSYNFVNSPTNPHEDHVGDRPVA